MVSQVKVFVVTEVKGDVEHTWDLVHDPFHFLNLNMLKFVYCLYIILCHRLPLLDCVFFSLQFRQTGVEYFVWTVLQSGVWETFMDFST